MDIWTPWLSAAKCLICILLELSTAVKDFSAHRINWAMNLCVGCYGNLYRHHFNNLIKLGTFTAMWPCMRFTADLQDN